MPYAHTPRKKIENPGTVHLWVISRCVSGDPGSGRKQEAPTIGVHNFRVGGLAVVDTPQQKDTGCVWLSTISIYTVLRQAEGTGVRHVVGRHHSPPRYLY